MRQLLSSIRRWVDRRTRRYGWGVPSREDDEHMKLQQAFRECAGQWVAIDRRTGAVVAARATPYELSAYIKERGVRGVDIIRAPAEGEPEVVGLG